MSVETSLHLRRCSSAGPRVRTGSAAPPNAEFRAPFGFGAFLALTLVLCCACSASAQLTHDGPANAIARSRTLPPYDVISVKQNNSEAPIGNMNIDDHGLFIVSNMPLESIIEFGYDIKSDQIVGLTGPVSSARFDVEAKVLPPQDGAPHMLPTANLQAMIILLLEDRFHLKAHLQPKTMPVYDMVVTHGGLRVKLSQEDAKESNWNINGENTSKILTGKSCSMADLAAMLSDEVHRKVIDRTGLPGRTNISLKWTDEVAAEQGGNTVSIFTALEEQLGVKLVSSKGPVDTLVIDHVEMPSQN